MTVFIVHGFNSRKHAIWMASLGEALEAAGLDVVSANYGHTNLKTVGRKTRDAARHLAASAREGDCAIGFSNGCPVIDLALDMGAPLKRIMWINPALEPDVVIAPWVTRLDVFYAPDDGVVGWGDLWRRYNPARLVGWSSPWGVMGRTGYQGDFARAHNWNLGNVGHSGALEFHRRGRLGRMLATLCSGEVPDHSPSDPIFRA